MTDRYVGKGGSDGANGLSWANRKLTLNGVEDTPVVAGDTIYVGPGIYRETLTCDVPGTSGNIITYIGDVTGENTDGIGGPVTVCGSDDDIGLADRTYGIYAASGNGDYRTFRGFIFRGSTYGLQLIDSDNVIYEDCISVDQPTSFLISSGAGQASNNATFRRLASIYGGFAQLNNNDSGSYGSVVENIFMMAAYNNNAEPKSKKCACRRKLGGEKEYLTLR